MSVPTRRAIRISFLIALGLGIAVRAVELLNCRSLGLDEARLAVNVVWRSFPGLLRPLELDQSAPPLFLWGERLAFLILGHSDCGLRLLPVLAGTAAVALIYPLATRFVEPAEAKLAALVGIFSPLLLTYSNAVKQYSFELLVAVVLLLVLERTFRRPEGDRVQGSILAAGAVAPWASLSSVFVLAAAWLVLVARSFRQRAGASRLAIATALAWGIPSAIAYAGVYRHAAANPYMQRFWELAFLTPGRPGFAWKTLEDQVWGFVSGDPLSERGPFLIFLHAGSALVVVLCLLGCRRVAQTRGAEACWWLAGPVILTIGASALGLFPIAPRLTLFLLPGLIVLFAAGVGVVVRGGGVSGAPGRMAAATAVIALPVVALAVMRAFSLEPRGHFQRLVRELEAQRRPGEPVYIFARTLPAWIFYSTDWSHPDAARLRFLLGAARSTGRGFENAPSRGWVQALDAQGLTDAAAAPGELLGLPSGMEWREVQEHIRPVPDSGWVDVERRRIEEAASPGVWVLATAWYVPEAALFRALERDATRRTFAHLRGGSALVRYEFDGNAARGDSAGSPGVQPGASGVLGRRRMATSAGR